MNAKEARRQNAIKKAKRKKMMILAVCLAIAAVIGTLLIVNALQQSAIRTFVSGNNYVTLFADGSFEARLPHNVRRVGTYEEHGEGDVRTISFLSGGRVENGSLSGNTLTIPLEWDDGHGHPRLYTLR